MSATCGQRIGTAQVDVRHGAALTIDPAVEALLSAATKPTNDAANRLDVALVEPEDVSAAVAFLASDEARYTPASPCPSTPACSSADPADPGISSLTVHVPAAGSPARDRRSGY